jgi:hypothetical protein
MNCPFQSTTYRTIDTKYITELRLLRILQTDGFILLEYVRFDDGNDDPLLLSSSFFRRRI